MMLILPHQDDELFCYSYLDKVKKMIIVFEGGGEPKGYHMSRSDLFFARCNETMKIANEFDIKSVVFLSVARPYTEEILDKSISEVFNEDTDSCDAVITTMEEDLHPDHRALSKAVKKYCNKKLYGFIVQTDSLEKYTSMVNPDISIKLNDEEAEHKIRLADNYVTQKHFLPKVIRRPSYRWERYWRLK